MDMLCHEIQNRTKHNDDILFNCSLIWMAIYKNVRLIQLVN
jgi:hypothetical protein